MRDPKTLTMRKEQIRRKCRSKHFKKWEKHLYHEEKKRADGLVMKYDETYYFLLGAGRPGSSEVTM